MPAESLRSLRQEIVNCFGDLATGSFADALLSFLAEMLQDPTAKPTPEVQAAMLRRARPLTIVSHQALRGALERLSVEAIQVREPESEPMIDLVWSVEQAAIDRFLQDLAQDSEAAPDLGELLWEGAGRALDQLVAHGDPDNLTSNLGGAEPDVAAQIDGCVVHPAGCGHERRTIVIIPETWPNGVLDAEVVRVRPTTAVRRANVSHPIVIREAAGLSLPQIADRLTEARPYAVDAAFHLHARNDVAWMRFRAFNRMSRTIDPSIFPSFF